VQVREVIDYDPITGIFRWKKPPATWMWIGQTAGGLTSSGYINIKILGFRIQAHRLAWFYMYGTWEFLDHKNRNKQFNAISNLRISNPQLNRLNQEALITNELGVKGVQKRCNRYRAYISVNGQNISLGTYDTIEQAKAAREAAAKEYFGAHAS
jgi:hypothetical protein